MKLFHCSYDKDLKVNNMGKFGEFMFFSLEANHYGNYVYSAEIADSEFITAREMYFVDDAEKKGANIIAEAQELLDCDADAAFEYLCERDHIDIGGEEDSEKCWELQKLTALLAKCLGYSAVGVSDEHGTSYMIDCSKVEIKYEHQAA